MSDPGFVQLRDVRLGRTTAPSGPAAALAVLQAWSQVVSSPLAERARPGRWHDGVLHLEVAEGGWRAALEALAPALRDQINGWIGAPLVREIKIVGGGC
jgi:predicted nucleic acid-binding Zn ribbon protein